MSELDRLREKVATLEAQAARARDARDEAKRALDSTRADVDARTKRLAQRRQTRQVLLALAIVHGVVAVGVCAWIVANYVGAERWRGDVVSVTGDGAPVDLGDACAVRLEPAYFPDNAHLTIQCEGGRVYGFDAFGTLDCEAEGGRAVRCEDDMTIDVDGDPAVRLTSDGVEVHDARWSASISFR